MLENLITWSGSSEGPDQVMLMILDPQGLLEVFAARAKPCRWLDEEWVLCLLPLLLGETYTATAKTYFGVVIGKGGKGRLQQ